MRNNNILHLILVLVLFASYFRISHISSTTGIEEVPVEDTVPYYESDTLSTEVLATYYNPVESQCDSDPLVTADMGIIDLNKLKSEELRWIAVSRDLLCDYPYGSEVYIKSNNPNITGVWKVRDTMNKRLVNRIDLLVHPDNSHKYYTDSVKIIKIIK